MILLGLALSGCGSLAETPTQDTRGAVSADSGTSDSGATTDTDTDTFQADPSAPVVTTCDAYCWYHTTGDQFYEWAIDCSVTDPEGAKNIWNGRWACTGGDCQDQSGLIACTTSSGQCNTSFKETQVTPNILCEQASSYTFSVWVSDWDSHESAPYEITGRQQ